MNWKLPNQLRHLAWFLVDDPEIDEGRTTDEAEWDAFADLLLEAAKEIELMRSMLVRQGPIDLIEEGDRANG